MPDWMFQIAGMLFAGGMYYGAIRADLKAIHEKIEAAARTADKAHNRIDNLMDIRHA